MLTPKELKTIEKHAIGLYYEVYEDMRDEVCDFVSADSAKDDGEKIHEGISVMFHVWADMMTNPGKKEYSKAKFITPKYRREK
jgi:hypothetical protein